MSEQPANPLAPIMESFARRLTPRRMVAGIIACFGFLAVLAIVYGRPEVLLVGVAAWFLPRLWRG